MNRSDFNNLVDRRIEKIRATLSDKASEYATDGTAFYNFFRASEINRKRPESALWDMATKHLVSIIDMVESEQDYEPEYIDEKIGDMINYLILLEGIMKASHEINNRFKP